MAIILSAVFAAISLLLLIVGAVLTLILSGRTYHRSGPQVGAEIMSGQAQEPEGPLTVQRSFFVGRAASLERQASIDFGMLKRQLAAGNCLALIPWLLAIGGFVGVLFFGALLFLALSPNVIGVAVLLVVLYALLRMGIAFLRA